MHRPDAANDDEARTVASAAASDLGVRAEAAQAIGVNRGTTLHAAKVTVDSGGTWKYVMASFMDGNVLGDGLRLLVSADGMDWSEVPRPGAPPVLPLADIPRARVFRDPSLLWHAGQFHLVFTSDLCVDQVAGHWKCRRHTKPRPKPRFGYAHSRDLVRWEGVRLIDVPLRDACSLWAPEISALPAAEGGGLLIYFTATVAQGICPPTMRESTHVPYFVKTHDMQTFTQPRPLRVREPSGSLIDMYMILQPVALLPAPPPGHGGAADSDDADAAVVAATASAAPSHRHVLLYKAEANLCGHPYAAPLEWRAGASIGVNASCSLVLKQVCEQRARVRTALPSHPIPILHTHVVTLHLIVRSTAGSTPHSPHATLFPCDPACSRARTSSQARAERATGPWHVDTSAQGAFFPDALSRPCVEGPTVIRTPDGAFLALFDAYRTDCLLLAQRDADGRCTRVGGRPASAVRLQHAGERHGLCAYEPSRKGFGAMRSVDLQTWVDVSGSVRVPENYKHGSALELPPRAWQAVCAATATQPRQRRDALFGQVCKERAAGVALPVYTMDEAVEHKRGLG